MVADLDENLQIKGIGQIGSTEFPQSLSLWGYMKHKVHSTKPVTINELRAAIGRKCTQIPNVSIVLLTTLMTIDRKVYLILKTNQCIDAILTTYSQDGNIHFITNGYTCVSLECFVPENYGMVR